MNHKKRMISLLFSSLLVTSCGTKDYSISLFIYDSTDTFILSLKDNILDEFSDFYNINEIKYAEYNQTLQNEQIVKSINEGKDLLLVNVVDRLAASSIIEKAETKNIPVIFFNREPLSEDLKKANNSYYVGTSPIKEGELQGSLIDETFRGANNFANSNYDKNKDGKLSLIILKGSNGHQDSELRTEHCISTLKSLGYDIDIISTIYCDWSKEKAKNDFEQLYEQNADLIELVISANDDMALGVIEYLKSLETYDSTIEIKDQFFPIFGIDATMVGKFSVSAGELTGTVINDSKAQAHAIKILSEYILMGESANRKEFPYEFEDEKFIHLNPEVYRE